MESQHMCGKCDGAFDTDEAYCKHECPVTGFTPADQGHLGEQFALIAEAALARGAKRAE